jgi:Carboxypeptidase regulatory-like domain
MSFWKANSQARALRHWGQRPFFWSVVCLSLWCLLCLKVLGGNGQARQLGGALAGRVTRAPVSPVILPNVSYAPSPVANVKVMVRALNGQRFATSITNERGYFRIALAPGTYQVTLGPLGGMAFSKDVPATITIKAKGEVWMEIHIDTGIR